MQTDNVEATLKPNFGQLFYRNGSTEAIFHDVPAQRHLHGGGRLHIIDDVGVAAAVPKIGGLC